MSLARFAKKRDTAEAAIIDALRAAGCRVWRLDRPFDLLCARAGRFYVLEVKTGRGKATDAQRDEIAACQAGGLPVFLVRTPEDALVAVGARI